jgi:hypothetical protein
MIYRSFFFLLNPNSKPRPLPSSTEEKPKWFDHDSLAEVRHTDVRGALEALTMKFKASPGVFLSVDNPHELTDVVIGQFAACDIFKPVYPRGVVITINTELFHK